MESSPDSAASSERSPSHSAHSSRCASGLPSGDWHSDTVFDGTSQSTRSTSPCPDRTFRVLRSGIRSISVSSLQEQRERSIALSSSDQDMAESPAELLNYSQISRPSIPVRVSFQQSPPIPIIDLVPELVQDDIRLNSNVINFSKTRLSEEQKTVLNMFMKYRQTPRQIPYVQLIASAEAAAKSLDNQEDGNSTRFRIACFKELDSASKCRPNIKPRQCNILKSLANNSEIIITNADKGGCVVVLDSVQYGEICLRHLLDPAYEEVKEFGTGTGRVDLDETDLFSTNFVEPDCADTLVKQLCRQLMSLLFALTRSGDLEVSERKWLQPSQPYSGALPRFYGLPKVHKLGALQIRPIIASCEMFCDKLMKKLKQIINLLLWGETSLKNSYELVNILEDYTHFSSEDKLISFDVKSLYTRVPIKETLEIVWHHLEALRNWSSDVLIGITSLSNYGIMKLLDLALSNCYFTWENKLYRQVSSLLMGGRLSPILANLYMENLEYKVLCSPIPLPKLYFRYVDDIVLLWDEKKGCYRDFLAALNSQHPSIILSEELEQDGVLPFLDVTIHRPTVTLDLTEQNKCEISIYRKATHSNRYLNYHSAHPLSLKRNILKSLYLRANRLLKKYPENLNFEIQHLCTVFCNEINQYPEYLVDQWFQEFARDLEMDPSLLQVNTRIKAEDVLDEFGFQKFALPTPERIFPLISTSVEAVPGGDQQEAADQSNSDEYGE